MGLSRRVASNTVFPDARLGSAHLRWFNENALGNATFS
jgi:hypothetical protein